MGDRSWTTGTAKCERYVKYVIHTATMCGYEPVSLELFLFERVEVFLLGPPSRTETYFKTVLTLNTRVRTHHQTWHTIKCMLQGVSIVIVYFSRLVSPLASIKWAGIFSGKRDISRRSLGLSSWKRFLKILEPLFPEAGGQQLRSWRLNAVSGCRWQATRQKKVDRLYILHLKVRFYQR